MTDLDVFTCDVSAGSTLSLFDLDPPKRPLPTLTHRGRRTKEILRNRNERRRKFSRLLFTRLTSPNGLRFEPTPLQSLHQSLSVHTAQRGFALKIKNMFSGGTTGSDVKKKTKTWENRRKSLLLDGDRRRHFALLHFHSCRALFIAWHVHSCGCVTAC